MKRLVISISVAFVLILSNCNAGDPGKSQVAAADSTGKVIHLTNETFKQKVFNYELNKEWKYEGSQPAIIDFYASWCGPCRQVSPIIEELAKEYKGKITVYKVNTDAEQVLSQSLGITSLPTIIFVPLNGRPQASVGALPKDALVKAINEVLLVK